MCVNCDVSTYVCMYLAIEMSIYTYIHTYVSESVNSLVYMQLTKPYVAQTHYNQL